MVPSFSGQGHLTVYQKIESSNLSGIARGFELQWFLEIKQTVIPHKYSYEGSVAIDYERGENFQKGLEWKNDISVECYIPTDELLLYCYL